jgi:hypothetical protein
MDSLRILADDMARWVSTAAKARSSEKGMHDLYVTTDAPRAGIIMDSLNHDPSATSIIERSERYRRSFAQEHPWRYHIGARWRVFTRVLLTSGTPVLFDRPFAQLDPVRKSIKLLFSLHYLLITIGGGLSALFFSLRAGNPTLRLLSIMALIGMLVYPLAFRVMELRYVVPMRPFLALIGVVAVHRLSIALRSGRAGTTPSS